MKKWINSTLICFLTFIPLILLDIYSSLFGLESYRSLFQTDLTRLLTFNWRDLSIYFISYLSIYTIFCMYWATINLGYKKKIHTIYLNAIVFLNILFYSAASFPQIYHPFFNADYWISLIPDILILFLYIATIVLIFYLNYKFYQIKKLSFIFLVIYFSNQIFQLFNIHFFPQNEKKINSNSLIIISLDSIRSDSYSEIQKYAKGTLKEYLTIAKPINNIVADSTQTRESFHSIFTGKNSFLLNNRYPFSDVFEPEKQNDLLLLKEIQQQNYRTIFIRDEQETVQLNSGPAIDQVITTSPQEKLSILINKISHSFVLFQIIPHFISEQIIPSSFNTSSQALGYNPKKVVNKMIQDLINSALKSESINKKNFIFIHSCISHTPVKLPFPYNNGLKPPNDKFEAFSYSDFKNYPQVIDYDLAKQRHNYDRLYYERMIQFVTEQYLNPLFDQLRQAGAYHPDKIILMSDHGENFWANREYLPIRKNYPFHGDTDLFGASADRPLLVSTFEIVNNSKMLNLSQALVQILTKGNFSQTAYTESSFSLSDETKDFLYLIDYSFFIKAFNKIKNENKIAVDQNLESVTSLYLQKSFYDNHLKVTFYRTPTGRKVFVCDSKSDSECVNNLWFTYNEQRKKWITTYNEIISSDIQQNKEIKVQLDSQLNIDRQDEIERSSRSKNEWFNLYAALLKLNLSNNPNSLIDFKNQIANKELLMHAYEQIKNRYWINSQIPISELLLMYDKWDNINQLTLNNRIEKFVTQRVQISRLESIHKQLNILSPERKVQLYKEIERELKGQFMYAFSYQLPYQTESYWTLLLKFSQDLDQVKLIKEAFSAEKHNQDMTVQFRTSFDKYLSAITN